MHLFFWDKNKKVSINKKLPKYVHNHIQYTFEQSDTDLNDLRCLEYNEPNDKKVHKYIRVYSQSLLRRSGVSLHSFTDLDKHPEVLLYKGYVDRNGVVHLEDLRVMSY